MGADDLQTKSDDFKEETIDEQPFDARTEKGANRWDLVLTDALTDKVQAKRTAYLTCQIAETRTLQEALKEETASGQSLCLRIVASR